MGAPQTTDAFFGSGQAAQGPNLPTADDFFGPEHPPAPQPPPSSGGLFDFLKPHAGTAHDVAWSADGAAGTKILNAMGQGAADAWGARPLGLSDEAAEGLRKAGIFEDYRSSHTDFLKAANEALIRPAVATADILYRGPGAILGALTGLAGGIRERAEEIHDPVVGAVASAAEETGQYVQGGALPELAGMGLRGGIPEAPGVPPEVAIRAREAQAVNDVQTARSLGVVGEGEEGFYGARPPTPEELQARTSAAQEAGVTPPVPEPPAPDVHVLARRIDPDTFEQFDAYALEKENQRAEIARLAEERDNSPEVADAQGRIDTILGKVNGVEARLTNAARGRLSDAQRQLDEILGTDSPEMAAARSKLIDADFAMRDLAPQVSEAYRNAREMAPQLPETAPVAEEAKPGEEEGAKPEEPPTPEEQEREGIPEEAIKAVTTEEDQAQARTEQAIGAGEKGASGEAAAPNVVGEQTLGEAKGKPERIPTGVGRAVEGAGDEKVRRVAERSEENAIASGLTETFGDLPTYDQLKDVDQAKVVIDTMNADYQRAKDIAMGKRQPPRGATPEAFLIGVENRALAEGDFETAYELKDSALAKAGTTMGQRISTYRTRTKSSPIEHIREVQAAREADLASRMDVAAAKRATVADIKSEVKAAASKVDAWQSFLGEIRCR